MKFSMKSLLVALLLALGVQVQPVSASTITVDPNPTDSFNIGNFFTNGLGRVPFNDVYEFNLTQNANATYSSSTFSADVSFSISDSHGLVALTNLQAGTTYILRAFGIAWMDRGLAIYAAKFTFTSVAVTQTPVPPALILFATALASFGFVRFRRRLEPTE